MHTHRKFNSRPVMAVLVSDLTILNLQNQIVHPRIEMLVNANQKVNNILYYFCLKHARLKERKIIGYYWNDNLNVWLQKEFPIPHILYIRGGIRQKHKYIFEELYNIIKRRRGKVINHPRFNKWQLYQILRKDPVMRSYLPVTREVIQPNDIEEMLKQYKVVYLKSQIGRQGLHVLKVETLSNQNYRYSYFKHGHLTIKTVSTIPLLLEVIDSFYYNNKSFLVQEAIPLMQYGNKPFDMRAELQHNGKGELEIVGICVRLGKSNSPITTHSDAYKFDEFFTEKMGYPKKEIEELLLKIHDFLFYIYRYIEAHYGEYVEIGIDFAIDTNKKIWLIEANSQSTKVSLEKAYDSEVISRAYANILEYSRYLYLYSKGRNDWHFLNNYKIQ